MERRIRTLKRYHSQREVGNSFHWFGLSVCLFVFLSVDEDYAGQFWSGVVVPV